MNYSRSEENGLRLLKDTDLQILSVGVSTGGVAEVRMAMSNPNRHIVATTVDDKGAADAKNYIKEKGFSKQIEVRLEDVSEPLSYDDDYFDYIYARLVLHYLPKDKLDKTLLELKRVLKPGGLLFIVVRSVYCPDAKSKDAKYDNTTGMTTIISRTNLDHSYSRYFHTEDSIKAHLISSGINIRHIKSYEEQLFVDFMREVLAPHKDHVIEIVGEK